MNHPAVSRRTMISAMGLTLAAAACAPGSTSPQAGSGNTGGAGATPSAVNTDAASMGKVTLTVWDQEVRGGGNAQLTELVKRFESAYPNITVKRVSRSFDDLTKTLRLALSGNDAPDVVQANNTRSQLGQFVKARQLIPLDDYAKAYGWDTRFPESVRATASYSPDARQFGTGNLYGVPQVGEVVGLYVNKAKLKALGVEAPQTWQDFESVLAKAAAKGEVGLMLGNLDKWPAIHVLGVVQGRYEKAKDIRELGYGNPGASWLTPANTTAMNQLHDWVTKKYFNPGLNGLGYDPAWQAFSKGKGVFLIAGTWLGADLAAAMKDDVMFMLPPPATKGEVAHTTGGTGLPFAITSKAKNPDAAAAFINFITDDKAMKVIAETGNLPVVGAKDQKAPDAMTKDLFTAFSTASDADALLPYLDWATPTMGDTMGAALQELLGGQKSAKDTLVALEKDYADFVAANA